MSKSNRSTKRGTRSFQIVARGDRRDDPDISRLMRAALDHYRSLSDPGIKSDADRPAANEGEPS